MGAGDNDDATVASGKRRLSPDVHAERAELIANRYQIIRWLGGGGMGKVYEALDTELGERIALKTLHRDLSASSIERFRREVRLTRKIQHPNVARMIDIGEHAGERFLTMELVDGPSLKSELGATMPWQRLSKLAIQICAGLEAAHRVGVVHRDLKPDNVLVERTTDRAVITDFGIARGHDDAALTQVGAVIGTPRYMAPEQLSGNPADARSDLFALGVMLYELATASRPWSGSDVAALAVAQLTQAPRPFVAGNAPPAFRDIVLRCLAVDPASRPASAAEVQRAIEDCASTAVVEHAGPTQPAPAHRPEPTPRTSAVLPAMAAPATSTITVLPFVCAPEDEYLADGIVEDLVDTLSSSPDLRVRPAGLVRGKVDPDPREVGTRLQVDNVVVGSVRRIAGTLRVATRLISIVDGFQLWSQRKDCSDTDVLTVSGEHARGVATALSTRAKGATTPTDPRAVELYLRARAELRRFWGIHNEAAAELLEEAALYAPTSPAILGALAYATVQTWLMRSNPALLQRAQVALARGLATGHGEAYLGSAVFKLNHNDFVGAAADLGTALRLAPMSASVNETVGKVLDELGAVTQARFHLDTAIALDPGREPVLQTELARVDALHGRFDSARQRLRAVASHTDPAMVRLGVMYETRLLGWNGERELMRQNGPRFVPTTRDDSGNTPLRFVQECIRSDRVDAMQWSAAISELRAERIPTRTRTIWLQIIAELAAVFGDAVHALVAVQAASETGLIDILWLERCPVFTPTIKNTPEWTRVHAEVAGRVTTMLPAFRAAAG